MSIFPLLYLNLHTQQELCHLHGTAQSFSNQRTLPNFRSYRWSVNLHPFALQLCLLQRKAAAQWVRDLHGTVTGTNKATFENRRPSGSWVTRSLLMKIGEIPPWKNIRELQAC